MKQPPPRRRHRSGNEPGSAVRGCNGRQTCPGPCLLWGVAVHWGRASAHVRGSLSLSSRKCATNEVSTLYGADSDPSLSDTTSDVSQLESTYAEGYVVGGLGFGPNGRVGRSGGGIWHRAVFVCIERASVCVRRALVRQVGLIQHALGEGMQPAPLPRATRLRAAHICLRCPMHTQRGAGG